MASPREQGESFLVVFDFDDTVCFGNSDEVIPRHLGAGADFDKINTVPRKLQWTNAMSKILGPYTKEQIAASIGAALHIPEATIEVFRRLSKLSEGPNPRVEFAIASDANSFFIEEGFRQIIKVPAPRIFTNPFVDLRDTPEGPQICPETGRTIYSKLTWHSPDSHACERCKSCPNMCKSVIVQQLLNETKLKDPTVIYIGDGHNDSCPMQKVLRLRDHIFVRRGFRLERILLDAGDSQGICHHHTWYTGEELKALFDRVISTPILPPIALFDNEGGSKDEFRTISLLKRMPEIMERLIMEAKQKNNEVYATLIATLTKLKEELPSATDSLTDPNGIAQRKEFLPIPQFLLNYGSTWGDLPWLQGEIYFNLLLWHVTYRLVPEPAAKELDSINSLTVDGFRSWAIPQPTGKPITNLAAAPPAFDMYLGEKTSVTETFFGSHIRPMAAQVLAFLRAYGGNVEGASDEVGAEIRRLLSACVWGNTVDLSMFNKSQLVEMGKQHGSPHSGHASDHTVLDAKVVANDMGAAAEYLLGRLKHYAAGGSGPATVDVVMDNMGVECAADMLLGLVLTSLGPLKVRYHTKPVPFCVSDVMPQDIERMLVRWEADEGTAGAAAAFRAALAKGAIEVHTHPFWVHPSEYRDMPASVAGRYFFEKRFGSGSPLGRAVGKHETKGRGIVDETVEPKSDIVIFKGDLNFRRLCGDRHWTPEMFFLRSRGQGAEPRDASVPFTTVLKDYWPYTAVPVLALRTNKSEVCVGPKLEDMQRLDQETSFAWRWNGQFAVALFAQ